SLEWLTECDASRKYWPSRNCANTSNRRRTSDCSGSQMRPRAAPSSLFAGPRKSSGARGEGLNDPEGGHMPQLVGSRCGLWRERLVDILEGEFCSQCENPVHRSCSRRDSGSPGVCALCGSDPTAAAEIRKLEEEQRRVVVPQGPLPGDDIIRTV